MAMRRATILGILLAITTVGAVLATHTSVGLSSTLLGRGTWERADLSRFVSELAPMHRSGTSTVAVVRATIAPGGTTGWHGHPGPSSVVVTTGWLDVTERAAGGGCTTTRYGAGDAFFHSEAAHTFVNPSGSVTAEFLVTYYAPAGPLLADSSPAC